METPDPPNWAPITWPKLSEVVQRGLDSCCRDDRQLYEQHRITPKRVGLRRPSGVEHVYAIAQVGAKLVFHDDVEDHFEVASLGADGVLDFQGAGRFRLHEALAHIRCGWR